MSIFKRSKSKKKTGNSKPLKELIPINASSIPADDEPKSVFDLHNVVDSKGDILNPPKRVEIKTEYTGSAKSASTDSTEDVSENNSYTLKKVQKKKNQEQSVSSLDSTVSSVDESNSHAENLETQDLEVQMNAAIDEISELGLDENAVGFEDISAHVIDNYTESSMPEDQSDEDVFDIESLDLELNADENDTLSLQSELEDSGGIANSEDGYLTPNLNDNPTEFDVSEVKIAGHMNANHTDLMETIETAPSIAQLRHDLSTISTDFENGDALYKRAQIRIKNLNTFAEKAELSFSLVSRLEPENRRLKARNLTLSRDLEKHALNLARIQTELLAQNTRVAEVSEDLETTHSQLSATVTTLSETEKELSKVKQEREIQTLRGDREKNSYEIEIRENLNLRSNVSKLTDEIDLLSAEKISLINQIESMKIDMEDLQKSKESSEKNAYDVTIELEKTRDHNAEITRQITTIQEDVKAFKTQYEYNVLTRDDRIFALESELQGLGKQLSLKDEILNTTTVDAQNLRKIRTDGELERERLERLIENQSQQLKLAEAQLLQSRANIQEMDKRYKDAATALARVNERRNDQVPSLSPDIKPAEFLSEISEMDGLEDFLTKTS